MALRSVYATVARLDGYCAGCDDVRPLVVMEHGPRGLRAWFEGVGPEDRELSYSCQFCGRSEHVPLTEDEDDEYAATLPTWDDASPVPAPVVAAGDVFGLAAARVQALPPRVLTLPAPRPPLVRINLTPGSRVAATDDRPLVLAVA